MRTNETTSFVAVAIVQNPKICGGKPTICGTRITVEDVKKWYYSLGWSIERIVEEYPHLSVGEVEAALNYRTGKVGG